MILMFRRHKCPGKRIIGLLFRFDLIVFSEFVSLALKFEWVGVSLSFSGVGEFKFEWVGGVCPSVGWGPQSRERGKT